jgi:hypothetical protein
MDEFEAAGLCIRLLAEMHEDLEPGEISCVAGIAHRFLWNWLLARWGAEGRGGAGSFTIRQPSNPSDREARLFRDLSALTPGGGRGR